MFSYKMHKFKIKLAYYSKIMYIYTIIPGELLHKGTKDCFSTAIAI